MKRYGAKTDANQAEIVKLFRDYGCRVALIEKPVDLLCIDRRGTMFTVEVKNPKGRNREQKVQTRWREVCEALGAPHFVILEGQAVSGILDQLGNRTDTTPALRAGKKNRR